MSNICGKFLFENSLPPDHVNEITNEQTETVSAHPFRVHITVVLVLLKWYLDMAVITAIVLARTGKTTFLKNFFRFLSYSGF